MSDYLVKLVRDDVEKVASGTTIRYRPIEDHAEMVQMLRRKLGEETVEYLLTPCLGELADILETVAALAAYDLDLGCTGLVQVMEVVHRKRVERGGFDKGIGMYVGRSSRDERGSRGR